MYSSGDIFSAEDGTASMEVLLCLPFVVLVLVLIFDMGYGWETRMKAEGAVRYAMSWVALNEDTANPSNSENTEKATAEVKRHYFPDARRVTVVRRGSIFNLKDLRGDFKAALNSTSIWRMMGFFGRLSSGRRNVELKVIPNNSSSGLLRIQHMATHYAMDFGTWHHDVAPLTLEGVTDNMIDNELPSIIDKVTTIAGLAFRGFFYLLGMQP